jgi:hypothetical protein
MTFVNLNILTKKLTQRRYTKLNQQVVLFFIQKHVTQCTGGDALSITFFSMNSPCCKQGKWHAHHLVTQPPHQWPASLAAGPS